MKFRREPGVYQHSERYSVHVVTRSAEMNFTIYAAVVISCRGAIKPISYFAIILFCMKCFVLESTMDASRV